MNKLRLKQFPLLLLMGFLLLSACGNDTASENAKEEVNEATEAVGDALASEKEDLKKEIAEAQGNIDRRLEKLNTEIKTANEDAKAGIQKEIDKLEAKRKKLAEDLDNFGEKADQEWEQFKGNVRETFKDIGGDSN